MSIGLSRSYMDGGGIDTSDATATAADILDGETAYVNGVKLTGTATLQGALLDVPITQSTQAMLVNGFSTKYLVETPSDVRYSIFIDSNNDVAFRKSTDKGVTWGDKTVIFAGTVTHLAIWYDRWSDIAAGLIHCAYTESVGDDTLYRSINTESSDALSTETTIFAGDSTSVASGLTLTRTRGGNLLCWTMIDVGTEGGVYKSTDIGATWGAVTINETLAGNDTAFFLPGFAADNQDAILLFWDGSANEISRQLYDDSANTWSETSIATSMADMDTSGGSSQWSCAVDLANSQIIVIAWNLSPDNAGARLRCWTVSESAITAKTDVISSSVDDQGCCAIGIETATGDWYAFYGGLADGSSTWQTDVDIAYKVSTDDGATWGAEQRASQINQILLYGMMTLPRFTAPWQVAYLNNTPPTGGTSLLASRGAP